MFIKIEIASKELVLDLKGVSAKNGKPYHIRKQTAYLHTDPKAKYPEPFEVRVPDGQDPYDPGFYTIPAEAFAVDRDKNLIIRPLLERVTAAGKASLATA